MVIVSTFQMHCFGSSHAAIIPSFHNSSNNLHENFVSAASNTKKNRFASFVSWVAFFFCARFSFRPLNERQLVYWCMWMENSNLEHACSLKRLNKSCTTSPPEYILASLKMVEKDTCIIHCLQEAHSHVRRVKNLCIWHFPRIVAIQRILATWLDACYFIGSTFFSCTGICICFFPPFSLYSFGFVVMLCFQAPSLNNLDPTYTCFMLFVFWRWKCFYFAFSFGHITRMFRSFKWFSFP